VPDMQVYQADKAEYTPDYTLTPLSCCGYRSDATGRQPPSLL
jgi:hypothetical protein